MEVILEGNLAGAKLSARKKGIAIVVDALRASATITTAMSKGIKEFYIAKEVEDARLVAKELDTLLIGERNSLKLPGFDFGNSPLEILSQSKFTKDNATFTSSTGARRIIEAIGSEAIIVGTTINAKAVALLATEIIRKNTDKQKPIVIIPAFSEGSIIENNLTEDQLGALIIAREFLRLESKEGESNSHKIQRERFDGSLAEESESVKISPEVVEELSFLEELLTKQSLYELFLQTEHAKKLMAIKFKADIEFCSRLNIFDGAPISRNELIITKTGSKIVKLSIEA